MRCRKKKAFVAESHRLNVPDVTSPAVAHETNSSPKATNTPSSATTTVANDNMFWALHSTAINPDSQLVAAI
jgi:hypothetical protein